MEHLQISEGAVIVRSCCEVTEGKTKPSGQKLPGLMIRLKGGKELPNHHMSKSRGRR